MLKKLTILILMAIITICFVGCSTDDSQSNDNSESYIQQPIGEGSVGDGSNKRGGQAKLDRIKSGEGRGMESEQ